MEKEIIELATRLVVLIVCSVITYYVIPFAKAKIGEQKFKLIVEWALIFVKSAENIIVGDNKGEERLTQVTELLSEKAKSIGISLSAEELRAIIEDAVTKMKLELK